MRYGKPGLKQPVILLFIVAIALHCSYVYGLFYLDSAGINHRLVAALDHPDDFANADWDDLVYIPRMNAVAAGLAFADPWTSHNDAHAGWGAFGLVPPIIGGTFIHIFGNYFLAMAMWALLNFSLIALVTLHIFRAPPLSFSSQTSLIATFVFMSFMWLGSWPLWSYDPALLFSIFVEGNSVSSEASIEAGLFTYVFYIGFVAAYFRYAGAPSGRNAIVVGLAGGFLSYVYFFHFIFAMAMLAGYGLWALLWRARSELRTATIAVGTAIAVTVPFLINAWIFTTTVAPEWYAERLSYSAGRSPFQDYVWLANFGAPLIIGILYWALRRPDRTKSFVIRMWAVIAVAYVLVLHVRVALGYMQAPDHFWRQSLGIPATLWCIVAVFDFARAHLSARPRLWSVARQLVWLVAILLPVLILGRTTARAYIHAGEKPAAERLTDSQRTLLRDLECMAPLMKPGAGFLSGEPVINYHAMANLKVRPFAALGLSSLSVETLTTRYLVAEHLVGKGPARFPVTERGPGYVHATDAELYLYINLFRNTRVSDALRDRLAGLYLNWNPGRIDWSAQQAALASVKTVFVRHSDIATALPRLNRHFMLDAVTACAAGNVFQVTVKPSQPG